MYTIIIWIFYLGLQQNCISEAIYQHLGHAIKAISSFLIVLLLLSVLSKIQQRVKCLYPFFPAN